jgi:hypothetical protein
MKRKWLVCAFLGLVVCAGGIAYWRLAMQPPLLNEELPLPVQPEIKPKVETEEEKRRRTLLGIWQDEYQGKRTMTLNADGTGTMLVELSGLQAMLFAAKLRFDMRWSLEDKKLKKQTVGGEPADKVNLILNTMGNTAEDAILEITDDRLLLLDKDGKTKYDWKRVKSDEKRTPV